MTQPDLRYLEPLLTPSHASLVTDDSEASRLAPVSDDDDTIESGWGYISRRGRVLAYAAGPDEWVIYEGEITVDADLDWESSGESRIWRGGTADTDAIDDDARRLFLAQSLRLDAVSHFAGWRDRVVALIPEEVGPKESKIFRTTATGGLEITHTYNVLDAIGTYSGYVHDLAMEFGSSDKAIGAQSDWPEDARQAIREEPFLSNIVQAWLLRDAADAQLQQARHSLKLTLGGLAQVQRVSSSFKPMPMAELARSLYTDRPNLTRIVKAAESDASVRRMTDYATSLLAPSQD